MRRSASARCLAPEIVLEIASPDIFGYALLSTRPINPNNNSLSAALLSGPHVLLLKASAMSDPALRQLRDDALTMLVLWATTQE